MSDDMSAHKAARIGAAVYAQVRQALADVTSSRDADAAQLDARAGEYTERIMEIVGRGEAHGRADDA